MSYELQTTTQGNKIVQSDIENKKKYIKKLKIRTTGYELQTTITLFAILRKKN